jgi:hypothetical protein
MTEMIQAAVKEVYSARDSGFPGGISKSCKIMILKANCPGIKIACTEGWGDPVENPNRAGKEIAR